MKIALVLCASKYAHDVRLDGRTRLELGEAIDEIFGLPNLDKIGAGVFDDVSYDSVGHNSFFIRSRIEPRFLTTYLLKILQTTHENRLVP